MLTVETIGRIRRGHFSGKTIRELSRELRVSRNTVRKILRTGTTSSSYERKTQPLPQLGPFRAALDGLLDANAAKSERERLTLIRLFEELRGQGYEGGYDAVRRYARRWERAHAASKADAYVPLYFAPGEAYQFDWSHEIVVLGGITTKVKVAHVRLCHSRMPFVRAYPRETQEMVFDSHERAFAFFKGACSRGIYDNMKTAVDAVFVGKDRLFNRLPADVQPLSGRARRLYAGRRLGEGPSREPGRPDTGALLHPEAAIQKLRGDECLALGSVHRLRQSPSPSRAARPDDLVGI
jgi:transposase